VYEEARHHLVFANELTRIMDVRVAARDATDDHTHEKPMIGVVVDAALIRDEVAGELPVIQKPQGVFDNASMPLPYTHRVVNIDRVPFRYIVAERLHGSGFDVQTVTIPPRTTLPEHAHDAPGLTVIAGEWSWRDAGCRHALANGGDEPLVAYEVDFR
jgi:hypothetical protein